MAGTSKANQRQSNRRKGYYTNLYDRVKINKLITHARHVVNSVRDGVVHDKRSWDHLKLKPKIDLDRASRHAKNVMNAPRIAMYLALAAK